MKKLTLLCTIFFLAFYINAQNVAINNDASVATPSAMLDVKSTTKGFMMPRMTSAQRGAIASPAIGLLVFDTDTKTIWAYNGSSWSNLSSAGGGGFTLPFSQTVTLPGSAFSITNSGNAIQAVSTNTTTAAITGNNNSSNGMGVMGTSSATNGIGVIGQTSSGTGVFGNSVDGVGVKASSTNGLALQVNGNLKISGGNTNPSNGAVLTSDASGNAVWKPHRIGFHALGSNGSHDDLQEGKWYKIIFPNELYDFANNFNSYAGNAIPAPADASVFTVPVDGVYHFECYFSLWVPDLPPAEVDGHIRIMLNRNGTITEVESAPPIEKSPFATGTTINGVLLFKISSDNLFLEGDKVYVEIRHYNDDGVHAAILDNYNYRFSGRLAIPY